MLKSIRWTLQMWHAVILVLALTGFGATLYYRISSARYSEIDAELKGAAEVVAAKVHGTPVRHHDREPEHPWPAHGPRRSPGEWIERDVELPASFLQRFAAEGGVAPYFMVWRAGGDLLKDSRPELDTSDPGAVASSQGHSLPPWIRPRGDVREGVAYAQGGARVVVGTSVQRERAELRTLAWRLTVTGGAVLVVGLAGGWLLSTRIIRPIRTIGQAAEAISASQLSQRIPLAETQSELGVLAKVLNATFDRLQDSFEQQIRFTADASHELRTPLAVLHSHVELSLSRNRSADEYRQTLETCLKASKRMRSLIDSLLLLARADAGQLDLHQDAFDLSSVADECVMLIGPLAAEKQVKIESSLEEVEMAGDPERVGQVVMNLLTNAIRYNRTGGTVSVHVRPEERWAIFSVSDTGVGIPEQDSQHVFDRFYRVDKARSREAGGSGLGLAICKSIVEAHGGAITLESRTGEGTTFTVRLPRGPAPWAHPQDPAPVVDRAPAGQIEVGAGPPGQTAITS